MITFNLGGNWTLRQTGERKTIPAKVPGCVHLDLLHANKIEDPFYRDNETRLMWIGEKDWIYSRTYTLTPTFLDHDRILLHCKGLDTLAAISINQKRVAQTNNMFRTF